MCLKASVFPEPLSPLEGPQKKTCRNVINALVILLVHCTLSPSPFALKVWNLCAKTMKTKMLLMEWNCSPCCEYMCVVRLEYVWHPSYRDPFLIATTNIAPPWPPICTCCCCTILSQPILHCRLVFNLPLTSVPLGSLHFSDMQRVETSTVTPSRWFQKVRSPLKPMTAEYCGVLCVSLFPINGPVEWVQKLFILLSFTSFY